ncbi:uncharacterized protein METZ01_LOCUS267504 [marine metagenome]|uniref:Uncharacterized protein n=1 Tax=marine metagenome TaxID=408172 RepID=A0A382JRC0_9ZZZZ
MAHNFFFDQILTLLPNADGDTILKVS